VHILSTDSDELGNTTRHFILYGEFIFKQREQSTSSIGTGVFWLDTDLIKWVFDKVFFYVRLLRSRD
jgi:hypothetical protein